MIWCVKNRTTYIPGIERHKETSVLPQGPSLCLNDSVAPLQPVASAKQDQRMNGRYFHNTHFFAKWSLRRMRGHFNWPFSAPIALRPAETTAGREDEWHLLPQIATQRVKEGQGEWGAQGWETRGPSSLTVMNEWITTHFRRGLCIPRGSSSNVTTDSSTCLLHLHPPSEYFTWWPFK